MILLIWCRLYAWLLIRTMPYQSHAKIWKWPAREQVWGLKADKHKKEGCHKFTSRLTVIFSSSDPETGRYPPNWDMPSAPSSLYVHISKPLPRVWTKIQHGHTNLRLSEVQRVYSLLCKYLSEFTLGLMWQLQPSLEWLWMQNGNYSWTRLE